MRTSATSNVYIQVIEDVVSKMRNEFIAPGGPGEGVLHELQGLWELKMMQAGGILGPIDRSSGVGKTMVVPGNSVTDLNLAYQEEFATPTADLLFPLTPLQTLHAWSNTITGNSLDTITRDSGQFIQYIYCGFTITPNDNSCEVGNRTPRSPSSRPSPHMLPPSPWLTQRPRVDVNLLYDERLEEADETEAVHQPMTQDFLQLASGKRKREDIPSEYRPGGYIPQQDGAADVIADKFEVGELEHGHKVFPKIPQLDGPVPDPYYDALSTPDIYNYHGTVNEDYNAVNTPAPPELQAPTPALVNDVLDDDEDEPLNEDDDDDDLDDVDEGEELSTQHLVLAQFDKVTRAKNKWKCMLKDGVMHINNRDILFNKASGDFDF